MTNGIGVMLVRRNQWIEQKACSVGNSTVTYIVTRWWILFIPVVTHRVIVRSLLGRG